MATVQEERLTWTSGWRLEWLIRRSGVKKQDLAERCGMHRTTLTDYLAGKAIPSPVLAKLADELNTTADFIIGRTDDPEPVFPPGSSASKRYFSLPTDTLDVPDRETSPKRGHGRMPASAA